MEHHMDVEYPCNLDQSDLIDVPELIPKPMDVATDNRTCCALLWGSLTQASSQYSMSFMRDMAGLLGVYMTGSSV